MQLTLAARQAELHELQTQLQQTTRELDEAKILREEKMLQRLSFDFRIPEEEFKKISNVQQAVAAIHLHASAAGG